MQLEWSIDTDNNHLTARSTVFDDGKPMPYTVFGEGSQWIADFAGKDIAHGSLPHCLLQCQEVEDGGYAQAVQNQQNHDESWPRDSDRHAERMDALGGLGGDAMARRPTAREFVRGIIVDKAGTSDADESVLSAAVDVVLSVAQVRLCWPCQEMHLHRDSITPYVLCPLCRSQDTRLVR